MNFREIEVEMEFLKRDFLDQLMAEVDPDTGKIIIEAVEFTPQEVLETDKERFDVAFEEWCENKRRDRLDLANEILDLYDNKSRFRTLKSAYKNGGIIPFVGAGLSIPSGYKGWSKFLKYSCEQSSLDWGGLEARLDLGEYEEVAQELSDNLGARFNELLENEFGECDDIKGAIRFLPKFFKKSVITTNFDNLLKRVYDESRVFFSEILIGSDALELPRHLGSEKNILLKLHGRSSSPRGRILTLSEYDQHYNNSNSLVDCIDALSKKTLLFVGCSLQTDRTLKALEQAVARLGNDNAVKHYVFLANCPNRIDRQSQLVKSNIFPIWYDGEHDECLIALFEKLATD